MRVLVATVAHRGDDARIFERQIAALIASGHHVEYVAPEPVLPPRGPTDRVVRVVVPRAVGFRRLRALGAARRAIRRFSGDVVLVHDLELALVAVHTARIPVVWDVHEDSQASVGDRVWIPRPLRRLVGGAVARAEEHIRRRASLLVAERAYLRRFPDAVHVPNTTPVPPYERRSMPSPPEVVYVGRISVGRGIREMLGLAERVAAMGGHVTLVGAPDADVRSSVEDAAAKGQIRWTGYVRNSELSSILAGATVGLALLADLPNYRHSMPTKLVEYLAHGVPFVATPLPEAVRLAERSRAGTIVPFGDVEAAFDAIAEICRDGTLWAERSERGWSHAAAEHDWERDAATFVGALEAVVTCACAG